MHNKLAGERWAFLATKPATSTEIRRALAVVLASVVVFLMTVPYARTALVQVPAFIPAHVSSLVICDLITATLLLSQFSVLRSPRLLLLAGGYLFTAAITFAYALVFPGLFPVPGLPHAGPQTSSAMYMFWHSGFPLTVIAYALFKPKDLDEAEHGVRVQTNAGAAAAAVVVGVLVLVIGLTLFATLGQAAIPVFLDGDHTTTIGHLFLIGVWMLSLIALLALWRRKPYTVLDVWLIVVMCVWLFDIALAALLNTGRYDLGWYVGRIYGLLAASYLLMVLLLEHGKQYARVVHMSVELGAVNKALARLTRQDGLTELANRRFFDEYLAEQIALAERQQRTVALVMCDVDHFKAFNDRYGHQAGDDCLKQVAAALQSSCCRPTDMAARYGGEEFSIILPDTELAGALQVAERARAAVVGMAMPHEKSTTEAHVTISGGVAVLVPGMDMSPQQLIEAADRALYQAKHLGRNRMFAQQMTQPAAGRKIAADAVVELGPLNK